jgi:alkylated DNA repair dioxygenase AlkB
MTDQSTELQLGTDQLPLFASGTLRVEPTASASRIQLDETSWLELVSGWLSGSETLLGQLADTNAIGWEGRKRWMYNQLVDEPRLTAEFPRVSDAQLPILSELTEALSQRYGVPYDGLWMNLYRNEQDSTSWHRDWPSCKRASCIVPVLSLGATRRFLIKARRGGPSTVLIPAAGDLVVMGGHCQRDWLHCVPKQTRPAGMRISINFQSTLQGTPERQRPAP